MACECEPNWRVKSIATTEGTRYFIVDKNGNHLTDGQHQLWSVATESTAKLTVAELNSKGAVTR